MSGTAEHYVDQYVILFRYCSLGGDTAMPGGLHASDGDFWKKLSSAIAYWSNSTVAVCDRNSEMKNCKELSNDELWKQRHHNIIILVCLRWKYSIRALLTRVYHTNCYFQHGLHWLIVIGVAQNLSDMSVLLSVWSVNSVCPRSKMKTD